MASPSTRLERAIAIVRDALAADPALIEELAPGMRLVKKPMTTAEQRRQAAQAMIKGRKRAAEDRRVAAMAAILLYRMENPSISSNEIAQRLNAEGHTKPKGIWS